MRPLPATSIARRASSHKGRLLLWCLPSLAAKQWQQTHSRRWCVVTWDYAIQPAYVKEQAHCHQSSHHVSPSAWQAHSPSSTMTGKAVLKQPDLSLRKVQLSVQHLLGTGRTCIWLPEKDFWRQKYTGVKSKNTEFVRRRIPLPVSLHTSAGAKASSGRWDISWGNQLN